MPRPITITITGCPSSGKSTVLYLLEDLLPTAFVIHQDDYQGPDFKLHSHDAANSNETNGFDMTSLEDVIQRCQDTGDMPPESTSRQSPKELATARQNAISSISEEQRSTLGERLHQALGPHKIGVVEGRSLHQDPCLLASADIRLFLRASKAAAKERELARHAGDGAGADRPRTEQSFEDTVWPNYVKDSAFLFMDDDVEGTPNATICEFMDISLQPKLDNSIDETIKWAVDSICHISERE